MRMEDPSTENECREITNIIREVGSRGNHTTMRPTYHA